MRPADRPERILGIDPGSTATGLVVREGDQVLAWSVVTLAATGPATARAIDARCGVTRDYLDALGAAAAELYDGPLEVDVVAIEGVRRPNPHVKRKGRNVVTDPGPIIGTGIVYGWLLARHPDAITIPPGGNGSRILAAYPDALVTAAERRHGLNRPAPQSSLVRHARSAYDVAGSADMRLRVQRASKPARRPAR